MKAQIVSFHCVLKNSFGAVLGKTTNKNVITATRNPESFPLKGLADGMQNLQKGEKRRISLQASEAYGFYDPAKIALFPKSMFAKNARFAIGELITIQSKQGIERRYRVLEVHKQMILLDGNHPLAGQDLVFEIDTFEARAATEQELGDADLSAASLIGYQ